MVIFICQINMTKDKDITEKNLWVTIGLWRELSHALRFFDHFNTLTPSNYISVVDESRWC